MQKRKRRGVRVGLDAILAVFLATHGSSYTLAIVIVIVIMMSVGVGMG